MKTDGTVCSQKVQKAAEFCRTACVPRDRFLREDEALGGPQLDKSSLRRAVLR